MAPTTPPAVGPEAPAFLDNFFRDLLDAVDAPARVFLPGGRVAAVHRAMARFAGPPAAGETMGEMIERYRARRADGSSIARGDLPYSRALRGEVVAHGERFELTLDDGSVYRTLVSSTPVVRIGAVVAVLSVWQDFEAYVRDLATGTRVR